MRLLHWYPNFLAGGAIAETVLGLANAQTLRGDEVLVACRRPHNRPAYNPWIQNELQAKLHAWEPTITVNFRKLPASLVPLRSLRLIHAYEADILHIHTGILPEDALIRLFTLGSQVVLTAHGAFYPEALNPRMRAYIKILKPSYYNRVSAFHAVSPHEATSIRSLFPSKTIYVVPNGLSKTFQQGFGQTDDEPRLHHSIQFLCVGRLDIHHKGLDILLHAFADAAAQSSQHLELLLVGPKWGDDYSKILDMIRELRLGEKVIVAGPKDRHEVAQMLRTADIFIQSSRWDAFSLAAIEAIAVGLPCILSSRIGAVSYPDVTRLPSVHIVEPRVDELSAAIQRTAASASEQREEALRYAPGIREFFSWERAADEHERVYNRLRTA